MKHHAFAVVLFVGLVTLGVGSFFYALTPAMGEDAPIVSFEIKPGEGAYAIGNRLMAEGIIRSSSGFYVISLVTGAAFELKPGTYELNPAMNAYRIVRTLAVGPDADRAVLVREGMTKFEVDALLAEKGILPRGALLAYEKESKRNLEGYLFPDTYRFFPNSTTTEVIAKFDANFAAKTKELFLGRDEDEARDILILAAILEKEVPDYQERRVVAGLLLKRTKEGMPLQVDASICYIKQLALRAPTACYPLSPLDFETDSPYNTYLYKEAPPGPIASPGVRAIEAALAPQQSPYWYYLSDPETGKTVFATTLDEHNRNRVKYLER